jgi:hypothetical protein
VVMMLDELTKRGVGEGAPSPVLTSPSLVVSSLVGNSLRNRIAALVKSASRATRRITPSIPSRSGRGWRSPASA